MMSRAAQTHLAGHMRPAGRVFETPALDTHTHTLSLSLSPSFSLPVPLPLTHRLDLCETENKKKAKRFVLVWFTQVILWFLYFHVLKYVQINFLQIN